jgi:hypothetical protein
MADSYPRTPGIKKKVESKYIPFVLERKCPIQPVDEVC